MSCQIRQFFAGLLLVGAIALGVLWGLGLLKTPSATAAIRQLEEAPGQRVYQSRQTLKDQHGNPWQAIAFKRIRPSGETTFDLRLVGFPGVVAIDRTQALTLTNSLGKTFTAIDDASTIFADVTQPEPNVGQYNLKPLLPKLQAELPHQLTLPTLNTEAVHLLISPALVQEWQAVADQDP